MLASSRLSLPSPERGRFAWLPALLGPLLALLPALLLARPLLAQDGAIDTLADAEDAVVLIEAVGTFVDPDAGTQRGVFGYGSGFLIDPSGLAITNNHVVSGGALYRVYVPGRRSPVNARVVGVSECADLAVIDLAGSGYPWLEWAESRVRRNQEVFAAGYPGDAMDVVLSEGVVTARSADGSSDWASLESVIAHTAAIEPGSSGGPLLNADGRVVGVNYGFSARLGEGYAIPAAALLGILDQMAAGVDVDTLGINGQALDTRNRTGIWVASVATGSIADQAGLLPGDLIIEMEHIPVGVDGVMTDYCDILRSHAPGEPLQVKVYREGEGALLAGQFNGAPLAVRPAEAHAADNAASALTWVEVSDQHGIVTFEAPAEWSNLTERDWVIDGRVVGRQIIAAVDADAFLEEWTTPGLAFSWSFSLDNETSPSRLSRTPDHSERCDSVVTDRDGEPGVYETVMRLYHGCEQEMVAAVLSLEDYVDGYIAKVEYYAATDADAEAVDRFFSSLIVDVAAAEAVAANNFRLVVDESGRISLSTPDTWREMESAPIEHDGEAVGVEFNVATNMEEYNRYWGYAGMTIMVFDDLKLTRRDVDEWLDEDLGFDECRYVDRYEHEGNALSGKYDLWDECNGTPESYYAAGVLRADAGAGVVFFAALPSATYLAGLEIMLATLNVSGEGLVTLQAPQGSAPTATVLAGTLNIRRGPGTSYGIIGLAHRGAVAQVIGQNNSCAWLVVRMADGGEGWISGSPEYVTLNGRCADLPTRATP